VLKNNDFSEALRICAEYPESHLAVIVKSAFAELKSSDFLEVSDDEMEAAKHAAGRARMLKTAELKRGLSALATVASVAPMIGLSGTVLAIINSFRTLTQGPASIDIVAGVISEALLTTGIGVLVAVPAFALYKYFERSVDSLVLDMDNAIDEIEARFSHSHRANYTKNLLALE
jgi:biopolymer transport protein ExbB/TolQ